MSRSVQMMLFGFGSILLALIFAAPYLGGAGESNDADRVLEIKDTLATVRLVDDDGARVSRELDERADATVIWFWSVKCGCVRDCEERIRALLERYKGKNVAFLAIDSNPGDSRADIEALRNKLGSSYPVVRDDNGWTVQRAGVTSSASVAVLDGALRLRFRGAIDDDRYRPTISYVHNALDAILADQPVDPTTATPYGCLYPLSD